MEYDFDDMYESRKTSKQKNCTHSRGGIVVLFAISVTFGSELTEIQM